MGVLPLCRDVVGVFNSPNQLGLFRGCIYLYIIICLQFMFRFLFVCVCFFFVKPFLVWCKNAMLYCFIRKLFSNKKKDKRKNEFIVSKNKNWYQWGIKELADGAARWPLLWMLGCFYCNLKNKANKQLKYYKNFWITVVVCNRIEKEHMISINQ